MESTTSVLAYGEPVQLGARDARLSFTRPEPAARAPLGERRLSLDGEAAFLLAYWCGTCPLIFERLKGANRKMFDGFQERLNDGLSTLDDEVIEAASHVIPLATYIPLLLEIKPKLVLPSEESDYFAHEQVAHQGIDSFWGVPHSPKTPYYRGTGSKTGEHNFLFEFIVPMVPPSWNDEARTAEYQESIAGGSIPTVLALSILDRTQPFDSLDVHTGLIHFVLDGHHKLQAAARNGSSLNLLALVSIDDSLSAREDTQAIAGLIAGSKAI